MIIADEADSPLPNCVLPARYGHYGPDSGTDAE